MSAVAPRLLLAGDWEGRGALRGGGRVERRVDRPRRLNLARSVRWLLRQRRARGRHKPVGAASRYVATHGLAGCRGALACVPSIRGACGRAPGSQIGMCSQEPRSYQYASCD
eukprot:365166-Chlamydomonas_euryale.AAC.6